MKFIERKEYWFTPDMELIDDDGREVNNKELPKSKQIQALISRPDSETRNELKEIEVARTFSKKTVDDAKKGNDSESGIGKRKYNFTNRMDVGRILRDHVIELKNVEVEPQDENGKAGKTESITTGAKLAESKAFGIEVLIQKLCAEVMRDRLDEQKKTPNRSPALRKGMVCGGRT